MSAKLARNEQIKTLYIQRFSYEKIGEIFNISKIRVLEIIREQLITNLKRETREKAFLTYNKYCNLCGENSTIKLHYIDRNRQNVDRKNVLPLCENCWGMFNQN